MIGSHTGGSFSIPLAKNVEINIVLHQLEIYFSYVIGLFFSLTTVHLLPVFPEELIIMFREPGVGDDIVNLFSSKWFSWSLLLKKRCFTEIFHKSI